MGQYIANSQEGGRITGNERLRVRGDKQEKGRVNANLDFAIFPRANSDSILLPLYKEQAAKTEMTTIFFSSVKVGSI